MRSSWLAGLLLTIVSLAWTGGATAHVVYRATAADCCYEIAYDQYEQVWVQYEARGNGAGKQGNYRAEMGAHLRMLATAVTSAQYVHFFPVIEERAAYVMEVCDFDERVRAPNDDAQPGPWENDPECRPLDCGSSNVAYPQNAVAGYAPHYARTSGRDAALVRIDRSRKRTEVVFGPPIRHWRYTCQEHGRSQDGGSGEGAYPVSTFDNLVEPLSQSPDGLPLVNANGKTAVCHVAGYQQVDLGPGGDLFYQFKGTYSASVRIKKVPSGARKDEVRKLGKLQGKAPQWLPGIYQIHGGNPGVIADVGPLSPDVPRTGCSRG